MFTLQRLCKSRINCPSLPRFTPSVLSCAVAIGLSLSTTLVNAAETTSVNPDMERIVVTATQTKHSELSAPASVSVINRAELDALVIDDLASAVRYLQGVNISEGTSYGRNEISLRGLDSDYTLILINGRRINSREALTSSYGNDFDLSSIPMSAIERIEVVRGPMSSLYGSEALGGVINVILRQPTDDWQTSVGVQYDTPTKGDGGDTTKYNFYTSGALIKDKLLANLIVDSSKRDAWRSDLKPKLDALEDRDEISAIANLQWLIDSNQDLQFDLSYADDERESDWNNYGAILTNYQQAERISSGLTHNGHWNWGDTRLRYYYENVEVTDNSALIAEIGNITQTNHNLDGQSTVLLGDHMLTGGAEYRWTKLENSRNVLGDGVLDDNQSALYLQDEFNLGELNITLGGRVDHHDVYGTEFSPRLYLVYNLSSEWVIKGGGGKAFKAPNMSQSQADYIISSCRGSCTLAGNPELEPETSVNYELSTQYQTTDIGGSITYFHNDVENKIITETWNRVPGAVLTYQNVNEAKITGWELQAWYDLTDDLSLSGNYSKTDAKDKQNGTPFTLTPEDSYNIKLQWQALDGLSTFVAYHYTGEQYLRANVKSDGYGSLDIGANYQINPMFRLKLGVTNLTDSERDDAATDLDYIQKSRSVYAGITASF
ncbi:TonB-dependent receptor [Shewanella sp. JNE10-2]|uniref:TonB-dependent receptor domain-containing protein n=1 Tax=unclassified Shewanella TaxID=196818 RepID=UPI002006A658|nr:MULTISPECIES: TonB-dependent receptor [unclassified Shewanella]MCK7628775.1 TonB-dependent receptor [Shewanella sp. JNE9-1]MCK7644024.1 TonB-dependent receptor [Shewanella sp. JNE3-1]MCK7652078.1 TonB-dependent receptor [Shewanella sp. JNE4-1]UPO26104.1 TonB-dependent receptor [Shewanella sp. JNE10-2]UPO37090.1 TonB-dependent receptor [Shewanella sp. JNE7]